MKLSKRILSLVQIVPFDANFIADIGADHGYVCEELIKSRPNIKIYACDNKKGPYERLKNKLCIYKNAMVLLSDGLNDLPSEVDTLLIAGMGGDTIKAILSSKEKINNIKYIIVSPHNDFYNVRKFLNSLNFKIKDEKIIFDLKKYYQIILYEKGKEKLTNLEFKYGPILMKEKSKIFKNYIQELIENKKFLLNKNLSKEKEELILEELKELKSI